MLRSGDEARAIEWGRSDIHRRRQRGPGCVDLGVEPHPPVVKPRLDDDVVVVPAVNEVPGEPNLRASRDAVRSQCPDAEQAVVATTTLHAIGDVPWSSQRPRVPALISLKDLLQPAGVDLITCLDRELVPGCTVDRDRSTASAPHDRQPIAPATRPYPHVRDHSSHRTPAPSDTRIPPGR